MEFIATNYAPIMFAGLIVFLLLGFPVAFSLGSCGLLFGFVGIELGVFPASVINWLPQRLLGILANDTLLAVPFFTFMGLILERSGMAEDLLDTVGQVFGPVRGGLALAVIFVGALLAATTGVVAASVIPGSETRPASVHCLVSPLPMFQSTRTGAAVTVTLVGPAAADTVSVCHWPGGTHNQLLMLM